MGAKKYAIRQKGKTERKINFVFNRVLARQLILFDRKDRKL